MSLLEVERLTIRYAGRAALSDVSLRVAAGEVLALVGRSGSGKSTLLAAVPALLPDSASVEGRVRVAGADVADMSPTARRALRGGQVGCVFQEPMTALDPVMPVGRQIAEAIAAHRALVGSERARRVRALLDRVGLSIDPDAYPHQLSGGQRQRVCIAIAIAADPFLLVADEPTAALDPLAREGIADLLRGLVRERGMGLLLVSHDLPLVAGIADRVAVLDRGRLVEEGARDLLARPASTALRALTAAARASEAPPIRPGERLVAAEQLSRAYPASARLLERRRRTALCDVSLHVAAGETLAVIGASGSGKSTLARLVLGLDRPDAGTLRIDAQTWRGGRRDRPLRAIVQAVFQDPADSLDPRMTVAELVAEPLRLAEPPLPPAKRAARVNASLISVGLDPADAGRRPHAFSGGQRQRIALARALVLRPRLVVLDEALSALDPDTAAAIADLLRREQAEYGTTFLFVTHDLAMVRRLAHRVAVLQDGRIVAEGPVVTILASADPYVAALVAASPSLDVALLSR